MKKCPVLSVTRFSFSNVLSVVLVLVMVSVETEWYIFWFYFSKLILHFWPFSTCFSGDRTVAIPQSMEIDRVSDDDSSPNSILNLALNSDMEELHENVAVSRESLPMLTGPSYSGALVPATAGHDLVPMTRRHQQRQRKLQVSFFFIWPFYFRIF